MNNLSPEAINCLLDLFIKFFADLCLIGLIVFAVISQIKKP
jgi:hypothetical protein